MKGLVKFLAAMISGMAGTPGAKTSDGMTTADLMAYKNTLVTNGYRKPVPTRVLNQRQRRKRARQQPHGR